VLRIAAMLSLAMLSACASMPGGSGNTESAPVITQQPASQSVSVGQPATFGVSATGLAPLTYQWFLNGAAAGTNASSFTIATAAASQDQAAVYVTVSNSKGVATSTMAKLSVTPAATAPTITTQPTAQTVTAGQTATFTVAANGTAPLTYQWYFNGAASGSNSPTLTIANTTTSQNGEPVYVTVTNSAGNVTSNTVKLMVNAEATAPSITTQPTAQTVTAGQTATFTVAATGTAPLAYQWYLNGAASGTNSATYSIANTTTALSGQKVYVKITNSAGNATSNMVTLTVNAAATAPTITTQPTAQTVTAGQTATFTVAASGTAPLTYQWYLNNVAAGTNSPTYSIANTTTSQSGQLVYVIVTNSAGNATSNKVALTVNAAGTAPSITTQPTAQTVTAGQTATFTVAATGTGPLTYQWYLNGTAAGTNSATYTITNTTTAQNGATIYVKVTNATGTATSNTVKLTVNAAATAPSITTQPTAQTVTAGQTATFTVAAIGTAPLTYQWYLNSVASGTNSATYSIANTTTAQSGQQVYVTVTNSAGNATSNKVTLTVNATQPPSTVSVLTYHNDVGRTGQNLNETILTTTNVTSAGFGKVGAITADGLVDAEPLYVGGLTVNGATHNVLYVATENDSVYAFDADTYAQLWKVSVLGANETASDNRGCNQVVPQIGVTSTPVIDPKAGAHGTIFVVAMSKDSNGNYYQRLHALDLTTGAELSGSPTTVQATFTIGSTTTTFSPMQYKERAALLLLNGNIYTTWASHCDDGPYQGWVIAYNESTLQQTSALDLTPNGFNGAIWMAGDGPAADSSGNIYFLMGNGTFDDTLNTSGFPEKGDYGNGFVKVATTATSMSVSDYFTMYNTDSESNGDVDLGSGGEILLPDLQDAQQNTWQLGVGAGKDGRIYIVNRTSGMMGKFNTSNDSAIYQEIDTNGLAGGVFSTPAYFDGTLYYAAVNDSLRAFTFTNAKLVTPSSSQSAEGYGYPGATPSISANGTSNGIVWVIRNNNGGELHAYDATNLSKELYNSTEAAASRDSFSDNKYITPMIANGKVYVATPTGVTIFGLLAQ
jgi:hypothetical protein